MQHELLTLLTGELLDDGVELTLIELSHSCHVPVERIIELVEEGVVDPHGHAPEEWRFPGSGLRRVRCALRLERDLGINTPGVALAIELLEELEAMRERVRRLEG